MDIVKNNFCLAGSPLFQSFEWRKQVFLGLLSACTCWYFLVADFLEPNLGYIEGKKKTQGTYHSIIPQVLRTLATLPSSLHSSRLCLYFCYILCPDILVILSRGNRVKCIYSIWYKTKSSTFIKKI